MLQIIILNTLP